MNFQVLKESKIGSVEMRDAYVQAMIHLAEEDPNIVVLDADLMRAMNIFPFRDKFPNRAIDCGIMEASMFGIAAGLSSVGKIPFAHTFAAFCARRACDQIYVSCAYSGQNVKIIGSDPGVTAQLNGGTHMPFEDLGIMRAIPGMTVIEPTDSVMISDIVSQVSKIYGTHYIRLVRKTTPQIYTEGSTFEIGRANLLRKGTDVTIIAMGLLVSEALKAAEMLQQEGISACVYDMFTIKPLDTEALLSAAKATGAIVTAENHFISTGLAAAVSEYLSNSYPVPMEYVGVHDSFGEVGPLPYLQSRFGLTAAEISSACRRAIERKNC